MTIWIDSIRSAFHSPALMPPSPELTTSWMNLIYMRKWMSCVIITVKRCSSYNLILISLITRLVSSLHPITTSMSIIRSRRNSLLRNRRTRLFQTLSKNFILKKSSLRNTSRKLFKDRTNLIYLLWKKNKSMKAKKVNKLISRNKLL